ncbi:hypothetical protein LINPERHAP1_LOCUS18518 [Linum perenne]
MLACGFSEECIPHKVQDGPSYLPDVEEGSICSRSSFHSLYSHCLTVLLCFLLQGQRWFPAALR